MSTELRLYAFGTPRLERDDRPINLQTRKTLGLLAYLAVTDKPHSRDHLSTLFWPESRRDDARRSLRRALWVLRGVEDQLLLADRKSVSINSACDLRIDVQVFRQLALPCIDVPLDVLGVDECLPALTTAATLYTGEFLAGLGIDDSVDFEEWLFFEGETLRQQLAAVLERLALVHAARQEYDEATAYGRRWLGLDQLHEPAHRLLMQLYAEAGKPSQAVQQYRQCVQALDIELGVPPDPLTVQLYNSIYHPTADPDARGESPPGSRDTEPASGAEGSSSTRTDSAHPPLYGDDTTFQPPSPSLSLPNNLPQIFAPLFGRTEEVTRLHTLLEQADARLITVTGMGGIGKTRLVLAVAEQLVREVNPAYVDGVWFVPLTTLDVSPTIAHDEAALAIMMASAIGVALQPADSTVDMTPGQLIRLIARSQMLLILDSFEHVLAARTVVLNLLEAVPNLTIIVTSQQRLGLRGEYVLTLRGLGSVTRLGKEALDIDMRKADEQIADVNMLVNCVQRVLPGFVPSAEDLPWIIEICRLVDGLPLAIELAAVWAEHFTFAEIAESLQSNLNLFFAQEPRRSHSLAATFDYAWNLLQPAERLMLVRITVFVDVFGRDAALAVGKSSIATLASLVNRSMVTVVRSGYYLVHPVIRRYAASKADEFDDQLMADTHRDHRHYYLARVSALVNELHTGTYNYENHPIELDVRNVMQAVHSVIADGTLVELRPALWNVMEFLFSRAHFGELNMMIGRLLKMLESPTFTAGLSAGEVLHIRSTLYSQLSLVDLTFGKFTEGRAAAQQAIEFGQAAGNSLAVTTAILNLAMQEIYRHNYRAAAELVRDAIQILRESPGSAGSERDIGGTDGISQRLSAMAFYLRAMINISIGRDDAGADDARRALSLYAQNHDRLGAARASAFIARSYANVCKYERAGEYYAQALEIYEQLGDQPGQAHMHAELCMVNLWLGVHPKAVRHGDQAVYLAQRHGARQRYAHALTVRGNLAVVQREIELAKELATEAVEIARTLGSQAVLANGLAVLGDACMLQHEYMDALAAYGESLEYREAIGAPGSVAAATARVIYALTELGFDRQTIPLIERVIAIMVETDFAGPDMPILIRYRIVVALTKLGDPRAEDFLVETYALLLRHAFWIHDESLRESFLHTEPINRTIMHLATDLPQGVKLD